MEESSPYEVRQQGRDGHEAGGVLDERHGWRRAARVPDYGCCKMNGERRREIGSWYRDRLRMAFFVTVDRAFGRLTNFERESRQDCDAKQFLSTSIG